MQTLSERRNLHVYFEQHAELTVQGECAAQKRLSEAEAEMNMRNREQRNSDFALHGTDREFESQFLELCQANQWADQAQREKINLCGELEMRNRLFQENHAKNDNKLRNYEESVAKKQIEPDKQELMNCLCNRREGILPLRVSS